MVKGRFRKMSKTISWVLLQYFWFSKRIASFYFSTMWFLIFGGEVCLQFDLLNKFHLFLCLFFRASHQFLWRDFDISLLDAYFQFINVDWMCLCCICDKLLEMLSKKRKGIYAFLCPVSPSHSLREPSFILPKPWYQSCALSSCSRHLKFSYLVSLAGSSRI